MKSKSLCTILLLLVNVFLPGAIALAGQTPSSSWGDCVAVLPGQSPVTSAGQRDDIGGVLTFMSIPYRSITNAEIKDDAFLDKLCVLFIASGSAASSDAAPHIARWVEQGGSLYTSGSALDLVLAAFPGRIATGGKALSGSMRVELPDAGAAMAFGKEIMLQVPNDGWSLIGKTDAVVHARGRQESSEGPLVVSFGAGKGWVVYNVLNAATDSSPATDPAADAQQKLVRFFVMRVLFAQQASQALRRFPSTPTALAQIADTVDPGKFSTEFAYTVRAGDDWDVALLWNGGRMGLTLRRPDAALVTDQSDSSPLVIPIRNAAPGAWKVFARGLDVPSANTPFVLMIIPRRGTNLLNGIPSPLQISKDVNVLMSNLGLALAMALLFALSAALFADTFAERQGQSNRLLSTVGSAAGKVSGIFSPLFMPTTWKLPPLVRRLAVAIGLAVFLALAALIASFLDSNFAPTSLRGVGIFAGMFVALAVGTLAYALAQSASARSFGAIGAFQIRPGYLIVVAVSVLASRLLGFVPGFLFGLPAGFAVLGTLEGAKRRDGMLAFVALLTPLAVGLAFWLLAIPTDLALQSLAQGQMDATLSTGLIAAIGTVQTVFLFVFFVALWQTLFELFPVAGLKGWTLFMRGRVIWFILLVVTAFLTLHALVNPNATALEMPENRALLLIVVVLAIYSAVAIGTWLLFNAGRLRGEGATPKRATSIVLVLTILIWLCVCVSGAALAALRYLGPK